MLLEALDLTSQPKRWRCCKNYFLKYLSEFEEHCTVIAGTNNYRKLNSDDRVTVDEEVSNSDDIQGSEEVRTYEYQSARAATTNNSIF